MSSDVRDTRARILDAALDRLAEGGGRGVSMSEIAKAAGLSRQAVYLHFDGRAELLTEAARRLDARLEVDERLAPSRAAEDGETRLRAFVAAWAGHLPGIAPVARALLAMRATDAEAARAWEDRMAALRNGCSAAVRALAAEERLAPHWSEATATDLLMTLLSVEGWLQLTEERGWTHEAYAERMAEAATGALMRR
jgi:AcrR family transcriptional regulator